MSKRRQEGATAAVVENKKAKLTSSSSPNEMDGRILKVMLEFHVVKRHNAKLDEIAKAVVGTRKGTESFSKRFLYLKNVKKLIGLGDKNGFRLTTEGLREAATPEYKEMMKDLVVGVQAKTDKKHHERIKKYLVKPKSCLIFDLLLEYKRLSRKQLSDLVGVNPGSHGFFYSLQELKIKEYVKMDPSTKLLFLSGKCFVDGNKDSYNTVDAKKLATEISIGRRLVESRKKIPQVGKQTKVKKAATTEKKKSLKTKGKKKLETEATIDKVNKKGTESKASKRDEGEETRNDDAIKKDRAWKGDEKCTFDMDSTTNALVEGNKTSGDDAVGTREKVVEENLVTNEAVGPPNAKTYSDMAGITIETIIDL